MEVAIVKEEYGDERLIYNVANAIVFKYLLQLFGRRHVVDKNINKTRKCHSFKKSCLSRKHIVNLNTVQIHLTWVYTNKQLSEKQDTTVLKNTLH